jgi:glycosyltransferase involved in cell wall biosynthesis
MRHRILFVKHELAFPRASGHDIRCFEMARALRLLGHEVALATVAPMHEPTRDQLDMPWFSLSGAIDDGAVQAAPLTYLQQRFRSYWGVPAEHIEQVARVAARFGADVTVGVGLDVLPLLAGTTDCVRVWYAADEWVLHHLTLFQPSRTGTYAELREALIKGLYERAYASSIDRAWVVSSKEQRAMRRYAGIAQVDVVPNGVDTAYYAPGVATPARHSAVFWGRLDFGPNLQALEWFCDRIWPAIRARVPDAQLTIMGFNAAPVVRARAGRDGIALHTDVEDIRPIVAANQVAVLPMISGGGIKNKLLEAAALRKAVVCTSMACSGLRGTPPATVVDDEGDWADAIVGLWNDDGRRAALEQSARSWVIEHHTWHAAARDVMRGLEAAIAQRAAAAAGAWAVRSNHAGK